MAYRNFGMYNPACPQTPAPSRSGARFPMSGAILETPSIMSSFRTSTTASSKSMATTTIEPPAMQFIPPFTSNSWNDNMMFSGNTAGSHAERSSSENSHRSQDFNNVFLNRSFTSNHSNQSSMHRSIPSAPSNTTSLDRSMKMQEKPFFASSSSRLPTLSNYHNARGSKPNSSSLNRSMIIPEKSPRLPSLSNYHDARGSNLNATISLFNSNPTFAKRKYPESASAAAWATNSKYPKISQPNSKFVLPTAASSTEAANSSLERKATLRIVSGTIDHIQKAIREQPKYPLLLETVANVLTIKPGTRPKEKVILLRNRSTGPVLQAVYYEIDADLIPLAAGDLVRCVGRIQPVGNRLQILKITRTSEQYDRAIARLQTVSSFTTKVRR